MADEDSAPTNSLEDPAVPAKDSDVPDPSGARDDPGTQGAIDDATEAAKDDIADALSDRSAAEPPDTARGEAEPPDTAGGEAEPPDRS